MLNPIQNITSVDVAGEELAKDQAAKHLEGANGKQDLVGNDDAMEIDTPGALGIGGDVEIKIVEGGGKGRVLRLKKIPENPPRPYKTPEPKTPRGERGVEVPPPIRTDQSESDISAGFSNQSSASCVRRLVERVFPEPYAQGINICNILWPISCLFIIFLVLKWCLAYFADHSRRFKANEITHFLEVTGHRSTIRVKIKPGNNKGKKSNFIFLWEIFNFFTFPI